VLARTRFWTLGYIPSLIAALLEHRLVRRGTNGHTPDLLLFSTGMIGQIGMRGARDVVWIQSCSQIQGVRSCTSSMPSTAMLPRWLHPPSGSGSLLSRPTSTSLYPGRPCRPINVVRRLPSSTLTNTLPPASSPLFPFPHLDSHFVGSTDIDSRPDAELEKNLGINRNLDHDDSPQHHNHKPNLDRYDPSQSHNAGEQSHKQRSSDLGPFTPPPPKDKGKKKSSEITDREWELRTGELFIIQVH
jgi:hypothetical protein